MTSKQQRFFRRASKRHPTIARGVEMMFDRQALQFRFEPGPGLEPGVGPGNTLRAVIIGGESAQFLELLNCSLGIEGHLVSHPSIIPPKRAHSERFAQVDIALRIAGDAVNVKELPSAVPSVPA